MTEEELRVELTKLKRDLNPEEAKHANGMDWVDYHTFRLVRDTKGKLDKPTCAAYIASLRSALQDKYGDNPNSLRL